MSNEMKVGVIVALITGFCAVVAAMVQVMPNFLEKNNTHEVVITPSHGEGVIAEQGSSVSTLVSPSQQEMSITPTPINVEATDVLGTPAPSLVARFADIKFEIKKCWVSVSVAKCSFSAINEGEDVNFGFAVSGHSTVYDDKGGEYQVLDFVIANKKIDDVMDKVLLISQLPTEGVFTVEGLSAEATKFSLMKLKVSGSGKYVEFRDVLLTKEY